MRAKVGVLSVALSAILAAGQSAPLGNNIKDKPAVSGALVYERVSDHYVFQADGSAVIDHHERIKVLSDAGVRELGVVRIPYAKSSDTVESLKISVVKPDGTRIATPEDAIIDEPSEVSRAAPFYSDLREKHIAVKGLAQGDAVEVEERVAHRSLIPGQFWLMQNFVHQGAVGAQVLIVDVPAAAKLTVAPAAIRPDIASAGARRSYTWRFSHPSEPTKQENKAQSAVKRFDVELTSFTSWQQVGDWYAGLQKSRLEITPELRSKAQELTAKAVSAEEKAAAIFRFVSQQYQYIGVSFGIGRYQPHAAAEVFANGYGDCKDKHVLLTTLLQAAGIPASTVLLRAGSDIDPTLPSPAAVDHVITMVELQGKRYFLDSTAEVAPFGFLPSAERNKKVLVISPAGLAAVATTPVETAPMTSMKFKMDSKLNEIGTLSGNVKVAFTGEAAMLMRAIFRHTPQNRWQELVELLVRGWGFGGKVTEFNAEPLEQTELPFVITYQYTRENYSEFEENRVTAPTPIFQVPRFEKDDLPAGPIFLAGPSLLMAESTVEIAAGLHPAAAGTDVDVSNAVGEFHGHFHVIGNTLKASRQLILRVLETPADTWKLVNELEKSSMDAYMETAGIRGTPGRKDQRPQELLDATTALQEGRVAEADAKLQGILAADPKNASALYLHAAVRATRNDLEGAVTDLREALKAEPGYIPAYQMLTQMLLQRRRSDEAIEVLKSWIQNDPANAQPVVMLAQQFFAKKQYEEARPYVEHAIKVEDSSQLEGTLGAIELHGDKPQNAIAAMQKAIQLDRQPGNLNNAAYELADHDLDLQEALTWATEAVKAAESRCAVKDLHEVDARVLSAPLLVASYWDTLGWIHFKLKNYAEAKKYLTAAWSLGFSPTIGTHLDKLFQASGDRAGQIQLAKRRSNQQEQRSFHLPLKLKSGSAEFLLLVEHGKVTDILETSSQGNLTSAIPVIKQLDFSRLDLPVPVVRKSVAACSAYSGCILVLTPIDVLRPMQFSQAAP